MESHPLNLAHQQHRRAEAHVKYHRYDEAMQCHHTAAELLLHAMKATTSSVALESLTLQHNYHLKQKDLIKSRKEQYSRVKKTLDSLKKLSKDPTLNIQCNENSKIQLAIYKTMNETDSLLAILSHKQEQKECCYANKDGVDGKSLKKDPETVAEELQMLNQNLHSMVEQLVTQVEVLKDKNMTLKERVNYLEKERTKYLNIQVSDLTQQSNFTNISFGNESFPLDTPEVPRGFGTAVVRPKQQPHFDLSAFKDD